MQSGHMPTPPRYTRCPGDPIPLHYMYSCCTICLGALTPAALCALVALHTPTLPLHHTSQVPQAEGSPRTVGCPTLHHPTPWDRGGESGERASLEPPAASAVKAMEASGDWVGAQGCN